MSTEMKDALEFFITTFAELAILFVIISFVVSVINDRLPPEKIKQLLSGNRGYGVAVSLGALTPFCSCSTLPMTIGLIKARAAFGPIMAFLFTSPLLNPFIVGLFWITFGAKITLIYSTFVIVLAIISGYFLEKYHFERFIKSDLFSTGCNKEAPTNASEKVTCGKSKDSTPAPQESRLNRWKNLLSETTKQFVSFAPYMMIGVAVGAVARGETLAVAAGELGDPVVAPRAAGVDRDRGGEGEDADQAGRDALHGSSRTGPIIAARSPFARFAAWPAWRRGRRTTPGPG